MQLVEEVGATETAQQIRLDKYPNWQAPEPKAGPKDRYRRTREDAIERLRASEQRSLDNALNRTKWHREHLAAIEALDGD